MPSRRLDPAALPASLLRVVRARITVGLPLLALAVAACAGSSAKSSAGGAAAGQLAESVPEPALSLCVPPTGVDTAAYHRVDRGGFSIRMPKQYSISGAGSNVDGVEFRSMSGRIVVVQGNYPSLFNDGSVETRLRSTCSTEIDGHPVEIVEITYALTTVPLHAPEQWTGFHSVVGARWIGALGGRDISMWIDTKSATTSRRQRAMFWTMRFARDTAKAQGGR